jgi:hypothetical protein
MRSKSGIWWWSHQIEKRKRTRKEEQREEQEGSKQVRYEIKNENIGTKHRIKKRWEVSQESDEEVIK